MTSLIADDAVQAFMLAVYGTRVPDTTARGDEFATAEAHALAAAVCAFKFWIVMREARASVASLIGEKV